MKYGTSHVTHSTVCYNSNKNNIFVTGNAHDIFCFWLNTWTKLRSTLRDIFPNVNKLFYHVHSIIAYRTVLNVFQSKMSDKFLFKSPITEIEWHFCGGESLTWITYTIFIYFIHVKKLNDEIPTIGIVGIHDHDSCCCPLSWTTLKMQPTHDVSGLSDNSEGVTNTYS